MSYTHPHAHFFLENEIMLYICKVFCSVPYDYYLFRSINIFQNHFKQLHNIPLWNTHIPILFNQSLLVGHLDSTQLFFSDMHICMYTY